MPVKLIEARPLNPRQKNEDRSDPEQAKQSVSYRYIVTRECLEENNRNEKDDYREDHYLRGTGKELDYQEYRREDDMALTVCLKVLDEIKQDQGEPGYPEKVREQVVN